MEVFMRVEAAVRRIAILAVCALAACGGDDVLGPVEPLASTSLDRSRSLVGVWEGWGIDNFVIILRNGDSPIVPYQYLRCGENGRLTITAQHDGHLTGSFGWSGDGNEPLII